jgi:lipoyl-dependent peroxiredoxin subunit C
MRTARFQRHARPIFPPNHETVPPTCFLIDPIRTVRFVLDTDFSVGRNPREILRVLDALQTDELCPSSWTKGTPTLGPSIT